MSWSARLGWPDREETTETMTTRPGRTRRFVVAGSAVVGLAAGYVALDIADVAPGILTLDTRATDVPRTSTPSGPQASDAAVPAPLPTPPATAPVPSRGGLTRVLAPALSDPALGESIGIDVRDGLTGDRLYERSAKKPRTPASTTKLLTAAAVTNAAPGDRVFDTRVVAGARPDEIVLVAGGDTLLAPGRGAPNAVAGRAGLADLAEETAASLQAAGKTRVQLRLDDTYARGPALAPGWAAADVSQGLTGPVTMLGTTTMRPVPGRPAPPDPALATTAAFADALDDAGVEVGGAPTRATARPEATQLGVVHSAPRVEVLALALDESDNALTESVARSAAAESGLADLGFESVAGWVRDGLAAQGIDVGGVTLHDTSGLTRTTRVPAAVVADVLTGAATGADPRFAPVVARLPVAGLSGTLQDRFLAGPARPAAGIARAKTGTLTGVHALGGTVVDADGRLLVYAVLADKGGGTPAARAALDRLVATLAACGCR